MRISMNDAAVIVISAQATAREHFAAKELQKYIEKIASVKLSIVTDSRAFVEQRIIIGGPERNKAAEALICVDDFQRTVPGPEGFMIQSFGENAILIAGSEDSCERGTVYGIYEFLERYLGCSLSAYSHPDVAAGEWVPRTEQIVLDEICYVKAMADRPFRAACVEYGDAAGNPFRALNMVFLEWLIKNRYNYVYIWTKTYEQFKDMGIVDAASRMGLGFMVGHHDASELFLPPEGNKYFPEKYYETHPEYYKLLEDGTRFKIEDQRGQMVFCSRNQEMIEQISENIICWLTQNPSVKMVQLAPHDGVAPQCVCEACKPYSKSENYTYFMNEIAKRVAKVHPDVKMVTLIYVDLWECPKDMELSPSLMVLEATWHGGLRTTGKPDGTSLNGTHFEENLLEWQKTGAEVLYYDYYMGVYSGRQRYVPMADEVQAIWKRFIEKGISGASTQIECFNLWNHIFNFYTFGRTAYDTELTMENNLERFARIFGEGAEWMKKSIRIVEECLDGQVPIIECGRYMIDHVGKDAVYECYEQALTAAKTALARNNIRLMRMVFRYTDLETKEEASKIEQYHAVRTYPGAPAELLYMTEFDSFWKNEPGYGIDIPLTGEGEELAFLPETDKWYRFE